MSEAERQYCVEHAEEAARLARRAATGDERETYERIATVWRALAATDAIAPEARETAARD